ncbi:hypothetical protein OCHUTO_0324 [Orientia chuto str. Dubai]|uniref:Uncharacterized protein n=1 Tax=Orientia chuto str. Dubai TaxID=1359168 RepID=A0A0F3MLZ7_9RICK|nr:hypothetical protein [Candidatus Orientia mediorientalis]KJV56760.1 hypothetical protein OCHUTO_0324 [Orientia chuto str. Dubai]
MDESRLKSGYERSLPSNNKSVYIHSNNAIQKYCIKNESGGYEIKPSLYEEELNICAAGGSMDNETMQDLL